MKRLTLRLAAAAIGAALASIAVSLSQGPRLAIGAAIGIPSFVLTIISRRQLGKSFSVMPEARALVTTGLYSRIQHPMYLFLDLFVLALILATGWPIFLIVWGILVVVQALQARREEKVLSAAFGDQYKSYEACTWI
jgi:protein-S-isoprenylcysteine O-methyltransferase Ste14